MGGGEKEVEVVTVAATRSTKAASAPHSPTQI
jgi:hypothetical protein